VADPAAAAPEELPPLRSTRNPELLEGWTLVLMALGVEHVVQEREGTFHLLVAGRDRHRAEVALAAHDREQKAPLVRVPPAPDQGRSAAGIGVVITLAAFYFVAGGRDTGPHGAWFSAGAADAARIVAGELYRAVTALTLHADPMHLLANSVVALFLVSALGRWLGDGLACGLTLLSGVLGNLMVAFAYRSAHISVGASTAVFGALGVLGGLQVVRWLGGRAAPGGRRRALSVVAACLGVFAMLGVGAKNGTTDVLAHLGGLVAGLGIGLLVGRFVRLPVPRLLGLLVGVTSVLVVAGAWALAL
jgi:membrane associated rhomboid family serine protease